MKKYLNTVVKFENPFGYEELEGSVSSESGDLLTVEILYGEHAGEVWELYKCDLIEDYGFSEETEEKFSYWYDEE